MHSPDKEKSFLVCCLGEGKGFFFFFLFLFFFFFSFSFFFFFLSMLAGFLISTDRSCEQSRWYCTLDNGTFSWFVAPKVPLILFVFSFSFFVFFFFLQGQKLGHLDALSAKYRALGLLYFEVVSEDGEKLILCGESRSESHQWLERLRNARRVVPSLSASSTSPRAAPSARPPSTPSSSALAPAPAARGPRDAASAAAAGGGGGGGGGARSPRESVSLSSPGAAVTPKSPRFSIFGGSPRQPRKSANISGEVRPPAANAGSDRYGWMTKKSKERWFLLRDQVMYWFTKEMPLDTDFRKEVRNFLSLEGCSVCSSPQDSLTITSGSGVSYVLGCTSTKERDDWLRALEVAIQEADRKVMTDTKKSGWLEKKKQRRWFVLNDLVLAWYAKEGDVRERGQLNLADCNCVEDDAKTFTLVNVKDDQIRYQLVAKSPEEAREWMAAIRRACQRAQEREADILKARATARMNAEARKGGQVVLEKKGWFVKKRKRRFYVLRNTVLMWFVNETDVGNNSTMKGSLQLTDCVVTARGFDLQIRTKEGVVYTLTATRKQDVDDWVGAMK